jgi:O-acetyl-ADP-ribose deacetylase
VSEIIKTFLEGRVSVRTGDITNEEVEAIVNAANSSLMGGGGVDGAIHRAGGPQILSECSEVRNKLYPEGLPTGYAVITSGGSLPARFVIHTVGPVWGEHAGRESELLASCYRNSLNLAIENGLTTIAFPSISTGAYGYPISEAAAVSSQAIKSILSDDDTLQDVRLLFFTRADAETFLKNQKFELEKSA